MTPRCLLVALFVAHLAWAQPSSLPKLQLGALQLKDKQLKRGLPTPLQFTVENTGNQPVTKISVLFYEQGKMVAIQDSDNPLEAHGRRTIDWDWVPRNVGRVTLSVQLQDDSVPPVPIGSPQSLQAEVAEGFNLSLDHLYLKPLRKGQETSARVIVHNAGQVNAEGVYVIGLTDGDYVEFAKSSSQTVEAGHDATFRVVWTPSTSGSVRVLFEIRGVDPSQYINKIYSLDVEP